MPRQTTDRSGQIAISISTADEELAKQIGEMLERIAYIDDCDTLGQKSETNHIHTVSVISECIRHV